MPTESAKAAAAFAAYCDLGPDRSIRKLRESSGKAQGYERVLLKWSSAHDWVARAAAADAAQRERERAQAEALEAARKKRQIERDIKREELRERMEDERAQVMHAEWLLTVKAAHDKVARSHETPGLGGMVGLTAYLKVALDEERQALGGAMQTDINLHLPAINITLTTTPPQEPTEPDETEQFPS